MNYIKTLFRNTTTENWLNNCIILYVHFGTADQPNMIEVIKDFKGSNQARLWAL